MTEDDSTDVHGFFEPIYNWEEPKLRAWLRQQHPDQVEKALRFFKFKYNEDRRVVVEQELRRLRRLEEESEMARRPAPSVPQRAELTSGQVRQAIGRFEKLVERLKSFDPVKIDDRQDPTIDGLEHAIKAAIEKTYGVGTTQYQRLLGATNLDTASINMLHSTPLQEVRQGLESGRARSVALLQEEIASLTEDLEVTSAEQPSSQELKTQTISRSVFVVHGHDEGARESVAGFLRKLGLNPVILHEHANQGRTIIEKFEHNSSDVGFAVVLLTPDDVGGRTDREFSPRARQNVILELGYFVGRLGRNRVCAMKKGKIEVPTDYIGVGYVDLDNGGWKFDLAREIKAAGIDVDLNKVV